MTATRESRPAPPEARLDGEDTPPDDGLATEAARLRSRRSLPVDRWFQLAGAVLLGVGLVAIIGGWYGVSHTAREWRQMPYLISGGLFGLALVVIGAAGYLAFWLTRLIEQVHRQTAALERIEQVFGGGGTLAEDEKILVAPPGILHRSGCPLLVGKTDLRVPTKRDKGLRTCPVCEPPLP